MVPKIANKLESPVLAMVTEDTVVASRGAPSPLGRKSVSAATGQAMVRWNYVELVKAATAFCGVTRGNFAIFDLG